MYKRKNSASFKGTLFLVVFATMVILTASIVAAGDGTTPATANPLNDEINTGSLTPGEQQWFVFKTGATESIEKLLNLTFSPDSGNTAKFVSLNVFDEEQAKLFAKGDTSKMTSIGTAGIVNWDNDPNTGQLAWKETLNGPKTYYIQLLNDSDFALSYWLFSDQLGGQATQTPTPTARLIKKQATPVVTSTLETTPKATTPPKKMATKEAEKLPPPPAASSNSPHSPEYLKEGLTQGRLKPHSTYFYSFGYVDSQGDEKFKLLEYTMFFTPDDGHRRHEVNFELFHPSQANKWNPNDMTRMTNFGAGRLVDRDGDYNTGERIWRGAVLWNNTYLFAVENKSEVEIDYWIYNKDIYNPILGPEKPFLPRVFAPGASPSSAFPLKIGLNKGGLEPKQEVWYSFSIDNYDQVHSLQEMALTMITTPDDGNRIRDVVFDVFNGGKEIWGWAPGDNSRIHNIGAGSVVYRDNNPKTGERFWIGHVVENATYYVQIRNNTRIHMDYWLYTGDVYSPELGEKSVPPPVIPAKPGTAPSAPLGLDLGTNRGHLEPKQERWYTFNRGDVSQKGSVDTAFTLVFTPDDGQRIRNVNFELFNGDQLREWSKANRFLITGFGKGMVVSRDGNYQTGELIWKGSVWAGNTYYLRVSNENRVPIDYWIFPDDVINTGGQLK